MFPGERGTGNYEEDALVLKVIEAYCTSDKMRYTVSSGEHRLIIA